MNCYKVEGGHKLCGSVNVHGAKNAALPILAATIINGGKSTVHNCPKLSDISSIIGILRYLGCKVERKGTDVFVDSSTFRYCEIPLDIMQQTRSSTIFAGALIARCRRAFIAGSGGCCIGKRPINLHLNAFKTMGADISCRPDGILCMADNIRPAAIWLDFPSVGATENIMLASALTPGVTVIHNAAMEPEIVNLAQYLCSIGVSVTGAGTSVIYIKGTRSPHDGEVTIIPDRIVAATYAFAVACAGGQADICGIPPSYLSPVISVMRKMGLSVRCYDGGFTVVKNNVTVNLPYLCTGPYPHLPTDCQPLIMSAMATSYGVGLMCEKIFENRFGHCLGLCSMGADISVKGRIATVRGVNSLSGANVSACDLRCGAALTVAALGAIGKSSISRIHYIDRGYEDLCGDLSSLGAKIERIE